jgi:hypothetical protein
MLNEVFHLLPRGVAKGLDAAEISGVCLHQVGIELVLAVVSTPGRLWRELLRFSGGLRRFGEGTDFLY